MEPAQVEMGAQGGFRLAPQTPDGEFAELVGQSLAGPADVPVDLRLHLVLRQGRVGGEIVDGLPARPALLVKPGVDHQSRGAPHLIGQPPEMLVGGAIDPHLDTEPFGVEAPALSIPGKIGVAPELRPRLLLLGEGRLQAVAGRALVQGQRRDLVQWAAGQVVGVHLAALQAAPPRRVEGRQGIRHRHDGEPSARQTAQNVADPAIHSFGHPGRNHQKLFRGFGVELRVRAQEMKEVLETSLEPCVTHGLAHLGLDASDLRKTDLSDLVRGDVQGGVFAHLGGVVGLAVRQIGRRCRRARLRQILRPVEGQQPFVGRNHRLSDHGASLVPQARLVFGRHVGRHLPEGGVEGAGFGIGGDEGSDRRVAAFNGHARDAEPARQPRAHVLLVLREIAGNIAHPRQVSTIVVFARQEPSLIQIGPERAVAVERRLPLAEPAVEKDSLQPGAEHRSMNPVFIAQGFGGYEIKLREHLLGMGDRFLLAGRIDARQPVTGGETAFSVRTPPGPGHAPRLVSVEQGHKPGVGLRLGGDPPLRFALLMGQDGRGQSKGESRGRRQDQASKGHFTVSMADPGRGRPPASRARRSGPGGGREIRPAPKAKRISGSGGLRPPEPISP